MDSLTVAQPGTVALEPPSTVLNPETISTTSGAGTPDLREDSQSIEAFLDGELAKMKDEAARASGEAEEKVKAEDAKEKATPAKAEKVEAKDEKADEKTAKPRAEDGKFAKAETKDERAAAEKPAVGQDGTDRRPSEGRQHQEPPARFLPEAREKWANVPREVKAEFHRVAQEYETEITRHREASERYEPLKRYDDIARSNGRELNQSLERIVHIEETLARSPVAGLEMILREAGPRKADGSPISLREVAEFVMQQDPQAYQQMTQAAQTPRPAQADPRDAQLHALQTEVQMMRAEQTLVPVVQSFMQQHPDAEVMTPQITAILKSGVIEEMYGTGLSLEQRLAEAYRMAGGRALPSDPAPGNPQANSDPAAARLVNPDAGKKSVRGAPSDGIDTTTEDPSTDVVDLLRKELRKMKAS